MESIVIFRNVYEIMDYFIDYIENMTTSQRVFTANNN